MFEKASVLILLLAALCNSEEAVCHIKSVQSTEVEVALGSFHSSRKRQYRICLKQYGNPNTHGGHLKVWVVMKETCNGPS